VTVILISKKRFYASHYSFMLHITALGIQKRSIISPKLINYLSKLKSHGAVRQK